MTIKELKEKLAAYPDDTLVVVRGYEEGYNNILQLRSVKIKPRRDSHWYEGEFDDSTDADAVSAVDLFGENKNGKD